MSAESLVLVVDDDRGVTQTLRDFLEGAGYTVDVADTGAMALQKIRAGTFGLVLLDLVLPDAKGTAVMREAQQQALAVPPEFIIMTGRATLDSALEAIEGSAAGYVLKPMDFARLGAIVRRVFERRRLVAKNARLEQQLAARLAETEALVEISRTVSSTLDLRDALRRICRALARLLGADTAAAYLHDARTDQLLPTAAYHVPKEYLATLAAAPLPLREQGFYLPVWKERRPIYSDDVARDARFTHEMFRSFPHQSGLLLPLLIEQGVAGGFYLVWWTARRRFDERELQMLAQVCEQVGLLLRNVRLYEQAEQVRHRLEVLNDVSRQLAAVHDPEEVLALIVNQAARLMNAEAAGMRLLEGDELVVSARTESAATLMSRPRLHVGESLSGLVVARGEPVVVEDLAEDTRYDPAHKRAALGEGFLGFIGVPLKSQGRVLGTLNVFTKGARHFLPDEVALLSALADQAATAIEKARLFRAAREGRRLLERLYHATISMQRSQDRGERLAAFVRAAREIVGFDRVNVFLLTADGAELEIVTAAGDDSAPALTLSAGPAAGPFHQALESRRPVVVLSDEDLARVAPLDGTLLAHPYFRTRRFVVAPLVIGARALGVVSADNKPSRRPIDAASVEPFAALCQALAAALDESRLYAEVEAREREARERLVGLQTLTRLNQLISASLETDVVLGGIARAAAQLMDAPMVAFWLADEARRVLELGAVSDALLAEGYPRFLSYGEGAPGWVAAERQRFYSSDVLADARFVALDWWRARGLRSYLAVPIVHQDALLAVLALCGRTPFRSGPDVEGLLDGFVAQATAAIRNAQIYAEAQTQRVRLAQIFDSTSDGILLVGPDGDIQALNRRAGELLGFDAGRAVGTPLRDLLAELREAAPEAERALGILRTLLEDPERGGAGDLELRRHGRIIHWVGQPTRDASGAMTGLTLTLQDVTHEREVSQMKSDFVSFVTHQLRTPLAGIKWMLELTAQAPDMPEEPASYVQDAREAADRLIGLVNDLLDASRLESGTLRVQPAPTSLADVTRSVLDELAGLVHGRDHRLTVVGAETAPGVLAEPQLLRQVILNLMSNAIKYTPPGGMLTVRLGREAGAARWAVTDTGVGIPKPAQARLFEKFFRADNALTIETEGTGLGLYLVRLIIEKLGGRVWCESEEGRGATFLFTLPLCE